jgi:hypothetical protein
MGRRLYNVKKKGQGKVYLKEEGLIKTLSITSQCNQGQESNLRLLASHEVLTTQPRRSDKLLLIYRVLENGYML